MSGRLRAAATVAFILSWVYLGAQTVATIAGVINADGDYYDGGDYAEYVLQNLAEGIAFFTLLFAFSALLRHLSDRGATPPSPVIPPAP